ncbi:MAG: methyltransferase domain-containing protein, partial [Erysipelotrichaceae bacterium]
RLFETKIQPHHTLRLQQGNAIDLSRYPDDCFDVVLVMGPLYHIKAEADRRRCIDEALRVCKPKGTLFFAFISNDMVIATELMNDSTYLTGNTYDHATFKVEDVPFVFFTVDQMRAHFQRDDIECVKEVAVDGLSELLAPQLNAMEAAAFQQYLQYHFYCCEKPELLGFSNHLLWIGQKKQREQSASPQ